MPWQPSQTAVCSCRASRINSFLFSGFAAVVLIHWIVRLPFTTTHCGALPHKAAKAPGWNGPKVRFI